MWYSVIYVIHGFVYNEPTLVGFEVSTAVAMKNIIFWGYIVQWKSADVSETWSMKQAGSKGAFLVWITTRPWRWMQYGLPKRRLTSSGYTALYSRRLGPFNCHLYIIVCQNPLLLLVCIPTRRRKSNVRWCFWWFSSVPARRCQDSTLNQAMASSFYLISNSLFTIIQ
jgi:hypothetical protein